MAIHDIGPVGRCGRDVEPPDCRDLLDGRGVGLLLDREDLGIDRPHGRLSAGSTFGLGKYHNRGIIDGFGGVSRGREQWTVRGSRELRSAPEQVAVGPIVLRGH